MVSKSAPLAILFGMYVGLLPGQNIVWVQKSGNAGLTTYSVAFSADGKTVLSGSECSPASLRLFDTETGNLEWSLDFDSSFLCIQGLGISINSAFIALVEEAGNILMFDNTGAWPVLIDTIRTGTTYAFSAGFAPTGEVLAIGASGGLLQLYQWPGSTLLKSIPAHQAYVKAVAWSPDGALLASGGSDNHAKIWSADGTLLFTLAGHDDDVSTAKFSRDNTLLVTGGLDGKINIWNTADGTLVRTIQAHLGELKQLDVSPDGSMIVSVSSDQTAKIWDIYTGALLSTFGESDGAAIWSVAWSPDGSKIVGGTSSGHVTLWNVDGVSSAIQKPLTASDLAICPNPAGDFIQLKLPAGLDIADLELCDATGRIIHRFDPRTRHLSVSGAPAGIFFLKISPFGGPAFVLRLIISRP